MAKLLSWVGLAAGGWVGWALGAPVSIAAAILMSIVGTGLGLYLARRIVRDHF